jgi:hypothetical protein
VSEVPLALAGRLTDPAKAASGHAPGPAGERHPRLDLVFRGVGQLEPAPGEQLDPVVGCRVVAGRQHDPEVGPERGGQVGHAGRRDDAKAQYVHPGAGQAGHHGGLKKLTGGPRVAAHHGHQAAAVAPADRRGPHLLQHSGGSGREVHGQLTGQVLARNPPNAVRAE